MSAINMHYSTIEDAWGSNFSQSVKKKHGKKRSGGDAVKMVEDPICELYGKRHTLPAPPFQSTKKGMRSHGAPYTEEYNPNNYRKYYGYDDFDGFVNEEQTMPKPSRSVRESRKYKVSVPSYQSGYHTEEEMDNDHTGAMMPKYVRKPKRMMQKKPKSHIKTMYEIDSYLSDSEEESQDLSYYDKPQSYAIEEEVEEEVIGKQKYRNMYPTYAEEEEETYIYTNNCMDERMYLDAGIFTISGIMLIFILEQFVQIGIGLQKT